MNMLVDILPGDVKIGKLVYKINTDFRIGILFEQMMQDVSVSGEQKIDLAISLYFKDKVFDKAEAIQQLLWFYRCGKKEEKPGGGSGHAKAIYSYEHDAEYIYSAFLEQYGIDLQDVKCLHWWKFKALFKSLGKGTKIAEIMGYRAMTIDSKMTKGEKDFYRKMKRLYRLPDERTEQEKEQYMNDVFASMF